MAKKEDFSFDNYECPEVTDLGSILGETSNSCGGGNNCTFGGGA